MKNIIRALLLIAVAVTVVVFVIGVNVNIGAMQDDGSSGNESCTKTKSREHFSSTKNVKPLSDEDIESLMSKCKSYGQEKRCRDTRDSYIRQRIKYNNGELNENQLSSFFKDTDQYKRYI